MTADETLPPWHNERLKETRDWDFATRFWPLFPKVAHENAVQSEAAERRLAYWLQLAPVYLAALNAPCDECTLRVTASIEFWPQTEAEHQVTLANLLGTSQLRAAWYAQNTSRPDTAAQSEALETAHRECSRPLAEIPLYSGMFRCACQLLVCLPLEQWQALDNPHGTYQPGLVDTAMVNALATRIAYAFNAPPQDPDLARYRFDFDGDPVVWRPSLCNLTNPMNGHGMGVTETGQYRGYYGCLRIIIGQGEEWRMAVLAPNHFIDRLIWLSEISP